MYSRRLIVGGAGSEELLPGSGKGYSGIRAQGVRWLAIPVVGAEGSSGMTVPITR